MSCTPMYLARLTVKIVRKENISVKKLNGDRVKCEIIKIGHNRMRTSNFIRNVPKLPSKQLLKLRGKFLSLRAVNTRWLFTVNDSYQSNFWIVKMIEWKKVLK